MYALCVGVRNSFFSLSCFGDTAKVAVETAIAIEEAWCSTYRLDPSWDERLNGQSESLVWCQDGSQILSPKHFADGFFIMLVKESKGSELVLWKPVSKSLQLVAVEFAKDEDERLRLVRPFSRVSEAERSWLRRYHAMKYTRTHLNWWRQMCSKDAVESDILSSSQLSLLPSEIYDRTAH